MKKGQQYKNLGAKCSNRAKEKNTTERWSARDTFVEKENDLCRDRNLTKKTLI